MQKRRADTARGVAVIGVKETLSASCFARLSNAAIWRGAAMAGTESACARVLLEQAGVLPYAHCQEPLNAAQSLHVPQAGMIEYFATTKPLWRIEGWQQHLEDDMHVKVRLAYTPL